MTIFDYINDLLFYKKGDTLLNVDDESQFNTYIINRWISMYSSNLALIINNTGNVFYSLFNKQEYYKFLLLMLPRVQRKHIPYIKKNQKEESELNDVVIEKLSQNLELSKREITYYIEQGTIDISKIKKCYDTTTGARG